ncbi:MAG TPA: alpha/beta hydrolase [Acidimicrobiia bacterium]|nr:alpha/beta hydrolase [Acidimicrobiia bacterium]
MVPGSTGRGTGRLTRAVGAVLLSAACASTPVPLATETSQAVEAGATTAAANTTSTATTTSTPMTTVATTVASEPPSDIGLEMYTPDGEGPFPAAVLVHGGGWVGGSPRLMRDLARFLAGEGILAFNAPYTLSDGIAGFPVAVDDIACAVRYAAAHPEGDGTVAVIGHSAGAHLAALVALDTGVYGEGCPLEEAVIPERLVGLAGPYDVTRLGPLLRPFFGVDPEDDPATWVAGNPLLQTGNNANLSSLLLHGENDGLVDFRFATDFADALGRAGSEVLVEVVEGARHNDMHDPDIVGELIVTWLEREG